MSALSKVYLIQLVTLLEDGVDTFYIGYLKGMDR